MRRPDCEKVEPKTKLEKTFISAVAFAFTMKVWETEVATMVVIRRILKQRMPVRDKGDPVVVNASAK